MVGSGRKAAASSVTAACEWSGVEGKRASRRWGSLAGSRERQEGWCLGSGGGLRVIGSGRNAAVLSAAETDGWSRASGRLVSRRWRRQAGGWERQEG